MTKKGKCNAYYSYYTEWVNLVAGLVPMYLTPVFYISHVTHPSWRSRIWLDHNNKIHPRLAFNNLNGKIKYLTLTERSKVRKIVNFIFQATFWVEYCDRPSSFLGLDAWHILPEWERSKVSWHNSAKFICPGLPKRRRSLQHQGKVFIITIINLSFIFQSFLFGYSELLNLCVENFIIQINCQLFQMSLEICVKVQPEQRNYSTYL